MTPSTSLPVLYPDLSGLEGLRTFWHSSFGACAQLYLSQDQSKRNKK